MSEKGPQPSDGMTFAEHFDALRPHLLRSAGVIVALLVAAFCLKGFLIDTVLFGPMSDWFPTNRLLEHLGRMAGAESLALDPNAFQLINTSMAGQLNLHLRISFVTALVLGFPYLLWELWRFVRPALTERELRGCRHFVGYVSLGFFGGLCFGYLFIAPLTIGFLTSYQASALVTNMIGVDSYLSTVIHVSLACAILFQLPLLVSFLTRIGLLRPEWLRRYRQHALVVLAILAAVITPPDAVSMLLILIPLYGLYECSIRISARIRRRMDEREQAEGNSR